MGMVINLDEYKKKHTYNIDKIELYEYISCFFEIDNVLKTKFTKRK